MAILLVFTNYFSKKSLKKKD